MKKILLTLMVLLMLTGCKTQTGIKLDAIVDIPLNPTEAAVETTKPSTEPVEETTEPTEAPTEQKTSTKKNNTTKPVSALISSLPIQRMGAVSSFKIKTAATTASRIIPIVSKYVPFLS